MTHPTFTFATATEIRFGRGTAADAVPDLARLGRRLLLVTGASALRSAWLPEALATEGCETTVFSVPGEPDVAMIEAGVAAARLMGAQAVIAIGGGAVVDAGKAIAALVPATRPMLDHLEVVGRGLPLEQPPLPFVALPTTAGTGAEVTRNAVIAVPEARRKVSLRDRAMLPDLAIVDPSLTDACPRAVTLASGLDAITQVIEPYLCTRANPMTDALCRDAILVGLTALRTLMDREDPEARDAMAWVSLCGGLALANAGLGVVHGLAGPLGGLTGAAHGAICGVLLPHGLTLNDARVVDPKVRARLNEVRDWIAQALGCAPDIAFDSLAHWASDCGLPALTDLGVTADAQAQAAEAAASSSSMKANPVALSAEDLRGMMAQAG
ncbi:iron-containing alcohol dehydrogenase [Tropicimonas isoalkanivorans]|uniref:Alcohol dehydrogenase, class IV n=1 Tax=Tropicimonas isoalkanivorans TaxID=441112 RepID=A0A1I1EFI8_9RHOB|nr:iron-containing alcohol dehydrogenase [Tropicimonas isoalkanivorans]SFB85342.1 Alcohol dehydrogenase, class IV [Tropicimonas isoalkanivorans]